MRKRIAIAAATCTALGGAGFGILGAGADYVPRNDLSRCDITETRTQHTIVANSYARVWERHRTSRGTLIVDYFACSNRVHRHFRIATTRQVSQGEGQAYESVELSEDSINAQFVAFVKEACPNGLGAACSYELRQLRLKNGQLVRRITSTTPVSLTRPLVFGAGELAYGRATPGCEPCEVHTLANGEDRVVDSGREVDLSSLSLGRVEGFGTVVWLNGTDARAATPGGSIVYD